MGCLDGHSGCSVGGKKVRDKGRNGSKDKGRIETGIAERARNKGRRDTGENKGQVSERNNE